MSAGALARLQRSAFICLEVGSGYQLGHLSSHPQIEYISFLVTVSLQHSKKVIMETIRSLNI